mmetsp:Transcript_23115/g.80559  ORF Transcript_23115/g.80559 Transcript_23115/m.80559 type:complete len:564 (-) Transcript_23115:79-1770(-)
MSRRVAQVQGTLASALWLLLSTLAIVAVCVYALVALPGGTADTAATAERVSSTPAATCRIESVVSVNNCHGETDEKCPDLTVGYTTAAGGHVTGATFEAADNCVEYGGDIVEECKVLVKAPVGFEFACKYDPLDRGTVFLVGAAGRMADTASILVEVLSPMFTILGMFFIWIRILLSSMPVNGTGGVCNICKPRAIVSNDLCVKPICPFLGGEEGDDPVLLGAGLRLVAAPPSARPAAAVDWLQQLPRAFRTDTMHQLLTAGLATHAESRWSTTPAERARRTAIVPPTYDPVDARDERLLWQGAGRPPALTWLAFTALDCFFALGFFGAAAALIANGSATTVALGVFFVLFGSFFTRFFFILVAVDGMSGMRNGICSFYVLTNRRVVLMQSIRLPLIYRFVSCSGCPRRGQPDYASVLEVSYADAVTYQDEFRVSPAVVTKRGKASLHVMGTEAAWKAALATRVGADKAYQSLSGVVFGNVDDAGGAKDVLDAQLDRVRAERAEEGGGGGGGVGGAGGAGSVDVKVNNDGSVVKQAAEPPASAAPSTTESTPLAALLPPGPSL